MLTHAAIGRVSPPGDLAERALAGDGLRFNIRELKFLAFEEQDWLRCHNLSERACGTISIGGKRHIIVAENDVVSPTEPPLATVLTRRELEIAKEIALGSSNKEIARLLGISPLTVREYVRRICSKLSVRSRAAIACRVGAQI